MHCDWFILPLLLPAPTMLFSLVVNSLKISTKQTHENCPNPVNALRSQVITQQPFSPSLGFLEPPTQTFLGVRHTFVRGAGTRDEPLRTSAGEARVPKSKITRDYKVN